MHLKIKKRKIISITFSILLVYCVQFYIDSFISIVKFSKKFFALVRQGDSFDVAKKKGLLEFKNDQYQKENIFVHAVSAATISDSIIAPTAGIVIHGTFNLTATAISQPAEPAIVNGIQFRLDGANLGAKATVANSMLTLVGNDATAIFPWDTTTTTDGVHSLTIITYNSSTRYGTGQVSPVTSVTVDNTAPVRLLGGPSTALAIGTTQTNITLTTNESATCKYSTSAGVPYASMTNAFAAIGGTAHSATITGLIGGNSYPYYVRCQDLVGNQNASDYTAINFSVLTDVTAPSAPSSLMVL
ncbi:MAG: Ig-like domain-containing protein [bacterium]